MVVRRMINHGNDGWLMVAGREREGGGAGADEEPGRRGVRRMSR